MSFHLGSRDPESLRQSLAQASSNKTDLAETTHGSLGYSSGSPVMPTDERMAGDIIGGHLGTNGDFANAIRDPLGAQNLQAFTQLLYNGPFSPLPPPIM
jgi:hypothetical protein